MKKLFKMSMIIPLVIVVGIVLAVVGNSMGNETLAMVGIGIMSYGLPAVMFILVVVGLVLMMTGKLSDKKSDVTFGEAEAEEKDESEKIEEINSSYGYDRKMKLAEYQMDHAADAYRNAGRGDRIKGWLFFGFLMTDFALIMVFGFIGIMVGMFVCMGIFAGTIILSLIISAILGKTSTSRRVNTYQYEQRHDFDRETVERQKKIERMEEELAAREARLTELERERSEYSHKDEDK